MKLPVVCLACVVCVGCGSGSSELSESFGFRSSPANGEAGVSPTRETVLTFDQTVDPQTIDGTSLFATVSSSPVESNAHVYQDSARAALFYLGGLPGDAIVTVTVDGDKIRSQNGLALDADGDGAPGGVGTFSFRTTSVIPVPGTQACARVFASQLDDGGVNRPLSGVRISVDGAPSIQATTGVDGRFCLQDAPAGRIFVHIDGTTATNAPPDAYFPSVGKAWITRGGERTQVGLIHLPAVANTTLKSVSLTSDTTLTFSEEQIAMVSDPSLLVGLDQVAVTVPPDSLFSDDGARGGQAGIAPVPPGRLPGALPAGLAMPLVITVQTDGPTNFDTNAPVCFPNLPHPITGQVSIAGQRSGLWSFNHDIGEFEVKGTMTVSADGTGVCSDPGVGIPAPGWFGSSNGTQAENVVPPGFVEPSDCDELELDVLQVGRVIGTCLKSVSGIGGLVRSINNISKDVQKLSDMREGLTEAAETYAGGDTRRGEVQAVMTTVRAAKTVLASAITAANDTQSPIAKAAAAVDCAQQALELAKDACENLTDAADRCSEPNMALQDVCDSIPDLIEALKLVKAVLQAVNEQLKDIALTAVCAAIDRAETELENASSSDADVLRELMEVSDGLADIPVLDEGESGAFDSFLEDIADLMSQTADLETVRDGPPEDAWIGTEVGPARQPLRSSEDGRYSTILPAEEFFAVTAYEPLTDRCGIIIGLSAAAGERTTLHGPQLGDCGTDDADGDRLSDFAEYIVGTSINVSDTDGDGIGDFEEVRAGTDPGGRLVITPGVLVEGDIASAGQVDQWRLVLNEPSRIFMDVIGIIAEAVGAAPELQFDWLQSDGTVVASSVGESGRLGDGIISTDLLPAGVYRLSISGVLVDTLGSYRLVVYLPVTSEAGLLLNEATAGNIEVPGAVDRWVFDANAGEELLFDMRELVGRRNATAVVRLVSPSNTTVFFNAGSPRVVNVLDFGPFTLTETGEHTLVVGDENFNQVYSYVFALNQVNATTSSELVVDRSTRGTVENAGDILEWTFEGVTDEDVFLNVTAVGGPSGGLGNVSVLAPDGSIVVSSFLAEGLPWPLGRVALSQSGTHRVVFRSETPGFSVEFALHKPTLESQLLSIGTRTNSSVSVPGEIDEWTFDAVTGDELTIDVFEIDGTGFSPYVFELFSPSGAEVFDEAGLVGGFPPSEQIDRGPYTLSATGTYRLHIRTTSDSAHTFAYDFRVELNR